MFTNIINNKKYVGQAEDVNARYKQHIKDSKYRDYVFYRALRKYGIENFKFEVLEENIDIDIVNDREVYWINKMNSKLPNGYNMTDGGEGTHGYKHTDEAKEIMRNKKKGKKLTEEHKAKISNSLKGKGLGKHLSQETKNKISLANKGRVIDEETKSKISESCKKVVHTEEWNKNVSEGLMSMSKEDKEKMINNRKNTIANMKKNGTYTYDCTEHFINMTEEEKNDMYDKISKNNPRSQRVVGINLETNEIIEFHSIGEAGRYIHKTYNVSKNAANRIGEVIRENKRNIAYGFM